MRLNELKKLVQETVRAEQTKGARKSRRASSRNWNKIVENTTTAVLKEEASVSDFRSKDIPLKLSDVNSDVASKIAKSGQGDTDSIDVDASASWSCNELMPSQTSMDLGKACWFALGMMNGSMFGSGGPGGDLACFVSKDNYLMDGHHRWIATVMVDPSKKVNGYKCSWPAKELIAVLNTLSVGTLGVPEGKPGAGGFDNFGKLDKVVEVLTGLYEGKHPKFKGTCAGKGVAGDSAKQVIEEKTGKTGEEAIKELAQLFVKNVTDCPTAKNPPGDFPQRKDMPVIDDDFVTEPGVSNATKTAMNALTKGELDITDTEGPKDGEYMKESINLRRWNKLAGILKD